MTAGFYRKRASRVLRPLLRWKQGGVRSAGELEWARNVHHLTSGGAQVLESSAEPELKDRNAGSGVLLATIAKNQNRGRMTIW